MLPNQFLMFTPPIKGIYTYKHTQKVENLCKVFLFQCKLSFHTIAFHCSEMASLSDGTSGQSKNLKKVSKLLARASQITYFILVLIYR